MQPDATQHGLSPHMIDTFLHGRTALVTGSTSGIGLAIASALAAHGAKVAINGLGTPEQITSAIAEVDSVGSGGTRHFGADLRAPDAIETMMAELSDWSGGGIDILVNNAGIQYAVPVHGLVASKDKAPYVASKFGIVGLSKVAALEYAAQGSRGSGGVTVNCICPGWVETPLIEPQIEARMAGGSRDDGVRA